MAAVTESKGGRGNRQRSGVRGRKRGGGNGQLEGLGVHPPALPWKPRILNWWKWACFPWMAPAGPLILSTAIYWTPTRYWAPGQEQPCPWGQSLQLCKNIPAVGPGLTPQPAAAARPRSTMPPDNSEWRLSELP